jgi:hypothetical protein
MAGPIARARLTLMELSCAAAGILSRGTSSGNEGLVGGGHQDRTGADHEREHKKQFRRHAAGDRERRQRRGGDDEAPLDRYQQSASIESICQYATDDAEHDVGEHVGCLDE